MCLVDATWETSSFVMVIRTNALSTLLYGSIIEHSCVLIMNCTWYDVLCHFECMTCCFGAYYVGAPNFLSNLSLGMYDVLSLGMC